MQFIIKRVISWWTMQRRHSALNAYEIRLLQNQNTGSPLLPRNHIEVLKTTMNGNGVVNNIHNNVNNNNNANNINNNTDHSNINTMEKNGQEEQLHPLLDVTHPPEQHALFTRARTKAFVERKLNEYSHSFTIHALTRVFQVRRAECIFWLLMLIGGLMLSISVCYGLIKKFTNHSIYTEIKAVVTDKNYFPSVTFCEKTLLYDSYFALCDYSPRQIQGDPEFTRRKCKQRFNGSQPNVTETQRFWSNGIFNVTQCYTWGSKNCLTSEHFRTNSKLNDSCITWNYRGDLHDLYSTASINFAFVSPPQLTSPPQIIALPHDFDLTEIDLTTSVDLESGKEYQIKIDKTVVRRLESPFPTKCVNGKAGDIFPGKYSRRSCIESENFVDLFKTCGDVIDYVRPHLSPELVEKYSEKSQNSSIQETFMCVMNQGTKETQNSERCRFPCHETDLGVMSTFKTGTTDDFSVTIKHQRVDTYKVLEERELYSWDQLACEIGGFLGLLMGASLISFVEILVYIVLKVWHKFL